MQHLIFLHGAIGSKDQLQPLANKFSDRYDVSLLNFSGHGGESFQEQFSIPAFADEVVSYMSKHQIEKASFFGYSMGGYVAMYIARIFPELVDKVITLGTKYYWNEEIAAREVKMLNAEVIQAKVPAFAEQLQKKHLPNDWKEVLSRTAEMLIGLGSKNALELEDYTRIDHECLLLLGEQDKMVTKQETLDVHNALPNGHFKTLPATPHMIEQVDVDILEKETVLFLQKIKSL